VAINNINYFDALWVVINRSALHRNALGFFLQATDMDRSLKFVEILAALEFKRPVTIEEDGGRNGLV
jgi:hypothetical protein